jgi:hypothetical protein
MSAHHAPEEPILIKDWSDLAKLPDSKTHRLEIEVDEGYGWIYEKEKLSKRKTPIYLSTHTFYGSSHKRSTDLLRSCGFNVTLQNYLIRNLR